MTKSFTDQMEFCLITFANGSTISTFPIREEITSVIQGLMMEQILILIRPKSGGEGEGQLPSCPRRIHLSWIFAIGKGYEAAKFEIVSNSAQQRLAERQGCGSI